MNRKYLKYAFRITHIENIPHIIKYGITTYASPNSNPNYVSIGDLDCFFTNGHALSALTDFFGKDSLKDINNIIDYDDVYARYWNSDSDLDLKRRKEAELLVKTDIPAKYIRGYVVYNEKAKAILLKHGIAEKMIKVAPDYYF